MPSYLCCAGEGVDRLSWESSAQHGNANLPQCSVHILASCFSFLAVKGLTFGCLFHQQACLSHCFKVHIGAVFISRLNQLSGCLWIDNSVLPWAHHPIFTHLLSAPSWSSPVITECWFCGCQYLFNSLLLLLSPACSLTASLHLTAKLQLLQCLKAVKPWPFPLRAMPTNSIPGPASLQVTQQKPWSSGLRRMSLAQVRVSRPELSVLCISVHTWLSPG